MKDFLRIVREDEDLRLAVRRELLTEELLTLPQRVSTLTDNVSALAKSIEGYKSATDRQLGDIVERLDRQHGMLRRQHDDLARFRGNYAFDAASGKKTAIARLFAQRHGLRRIFARALSEEDRARLVDGNTDALQALEFDDDVWDSFIERSDLIAEVTNLHGRDQPRYYIAVEASFTGHDKDVTRAVDHAKIVRSATGLDAYAVVAAVRLDPHVTRDNILEDADQYLAADSEDAALWYPLVEEDLEPPDPC